MIRLRAFVVLLTLLALISGAISQTVDNFDAHCADIVMLQAKPVQQALKVTEDQRRRLNVHASWHQSQLKAIDDQIRQQKLDPQKADVQARVAALFSELKNRVIKELSAAQLRRLRELSLQRVGDASLCDPVVAKRVGMSDSQLKRMQDIFKEGAQKFSALEQAEAQKVLAPYKDRRPKDAAEAQQLNREVQTKMAAAARTAKPRLDALRAQYRQRMLALLTSSQKSAFNALKGAPLRG